MGAGGATAGEASTPSCLEPDSQTFGPRAAQSPTLAALGRCDLVKDGLTTRQSFLEGGEGTSPCTAHGHPRAQRRTAIQPSAPLPAEPWSSPFRRGRASEFA